MLRTLLASFLLAASSAFAAWPQDTSDLKPDPKAVFGSLKNGLRYVILPHAEPPGRASIRLYMDVGSLMEEDDQQGMAHYLEHMAFNGSRNFKGGDMVEYFQRLGMGFGADTNAHTSFKETVYMLELPKVEPKYITEGMQLFRDYLDGMLLGEQEIDKERGIILSEKLSRDSIEYRTMIEGYKFALPESLLPHRLPIGIEETIKTMKRPRFVDFYSKWYTPQRAAIVAVGDFKDTKAVVAEIEKHFADAKKAKQPAKDPSLGKISSGHGLIAKLHTEMQAQALTISIERQRAAEPRPDTAAERRKKLVRVLADSMINQRLSKLAKAEGAPIIGAEAYSYEQFEFVLTSGIQAQCDPKNWKPALALIETEIRRALLHGFTDAEFDEVKASTIKSAKLRADQADSRKSRDLASGLVSQLAAKKVFTHPADDLTRVSQVIETIKKEDCHAALAADWKGEDIQVFLGGNLKLEGDASEQILAAYKSSAAKPVEAPKKEETAAFAYTDFGPAGKVASRTEARDLEVTQAVFENNVRFNFKRTEFEKGTIRVLINFGGGKLSAPQGKPGLIAFAGSTFQLGGLVKHDVDELRRIFASRTVGTDFSIGDEAFLLAGRTTPDDLDAQLQLLTAYLTAPGYRIEAARQFEKNIDPMYTQLQHTAEGVMNNEVMAFTHGGDPRWGFPAKQVLKQRNLDEVKEWLTPALTQEYLEVTVLGDVDVEKALDAVSRTLGALPERAGKKPDYAKERQVAFPKPAESKAFHFDTEIPKAIATIYWPTEDMPSDVPRARRLMLLSQVLDDRLRIKIREELADTYSPACYHVASDTFTGYGYMVTMIECKPEQVEKLAKLTIEIADKLATGEITDDEFERAYKPMVAQIEQQRRDNRYWSSTVLRCSQEHPQRLDWARSFVSDITGIQKSDLVPLAKKYLPKARAVTANIIPNAQK
ncbi:MAG: insulinase family protein [Verrucomicrobiaceae bacterium]|nr:insulinase family protein [Verrucomicrobiaceae bacterium]